MLIVFSSLLPDIIKGDLDSLRADVEDFYVKAVRTDHVTSWLLDNLTASSQGVLVLTDKDQYETDLGKCIKSLQELEAQQQRQVTANFPSWSRRCSSALPSLKYELVIYGGLTGRLDQTAHTIHVLFKLSRKRQRTWVVSEDSVTCLLQEVR